MKHKLFTLLLCCILICTAKAQYVTIPDANFRNFLQTNYPTAFNSAGKMDTTNSLIVVEYSLNCSYNNIANLDGVQYFKSLYRLECSANVLSSLPNNLPNTIWYLYCNDNLLTSLPSKLPGQLHYLYCGNNLLTSLPHFSIPLHLLSAYGNKFSTFPDLNDTTSEIFLGNNLFTSIPKIPKYASIFDVSKCPNLTCLPPLPDVVQITYYAWNSDLNLYFDTANIKCLPNIPYGTYINGAKRSYPICSATYNPNNCIIIPQKTYVEINDRGIAKYIYTQCDTCLGRGNGTYLNFFSEMPQYLDTSTWITKITTLGAQDYGIFSLKDLKYFPKLEDLIVNYNYFSRLDYLPNSIKFIQAIRYSDLSQPSIDTIGKLPDSLLSLMLSYAGISQLPTLPKTLTYLSLGGFNNIYCLPTLPDSLKALDFDSSKIKCFPNLPSKVQLTDNNGPLPTYPVCNPTNNVNGCPSHSPNFIGLTYIDVNKNGIKESTEPFFKNSRIDINNRFNFSNNYGKYSIFTDAGGSFTIKPAAKDLFKVVPDSAVFIVPNIDTVINQNFAYQFLVSKDSVALTTTNYNWRARRGSSFPIYLKFDNVGTTNLSNLNLAINYNNAILTYDSSSIAGVVNTGNSLTLNAASLTYGESKNFVAYFKLKTTIPIGDTVVCLYSNISNTNTSASDSTCTIIVGSYDPNDKEATPELSTQQVADGKRIDYTIRFQNTGNDTAIHIVIADTLSSKLQANSLQIIATSHDCKTSIKDGVVFFEMRNIMLPDSNVNKLKSNGFIRFTMLPQSSVVAGDNIPNSAAIYFDYNKPVITNIATTIIKNNVLPLQMLDFTAIIKNKNAVLNWQTANEVNTQSFVIQQSLDGRIFKSVAEVIATNAHHYTATSKLNDNFNIVYFRLMIKDKDGSYTYSKIVKLVITNEPGITILSNPAKSELHFIASNSLLNSTASIINTNGIVVQQFIISNSTQKVSLNSLPKGLYYLHAKDCSKKFIKE